MVILIIVQVQLQYVHQHLHFDSQFHLDDLLHLFQKRTFGYKWCRFFYGLDAFLSPSEECQNSRRNSTHTVHKITDQLTGAAVDRWCQVLPVFLVIVWCQLLTGQVVLRPPIITATLTDQSRVKNQVNCGHCSRLSVATPQTLVSVLQNPSFDFPANGSYIQYLFWYTGEVYCICFLIVIFRS